VNESLKIIGILAICWFLQIWKFFDFEAIKTWTGYDLATENLEKATNYTKDRLELEKGSKPDQEPIPTAKLDIEKIKSTCTDNLNLKARIKQKYIDAYLDLFKSNQELNSILLGTQSADYRFCIRKDGGFVFISDTEDNGVVVFLQKRKPIILKTVEQLSQKAKQ
jgi:hypothetical protein